MVKEGTLESGLRLWCPKRIGPIPWAGYIPVPDTVRHLWSMQKERRFKNGPGDFQDIIEIEAVAPLLILHNWPHLLQNTLWIHFIDNNSALGSLVKGSASVTQQDLVVGHTWALIAKLGAMPWFDRVDTHSNPVDGLSRGDFSGTWNWKTIEFPAELISDLKDQME